MHQNAYQARMLEAANAHLEALARIQATLDAQAERLDRQDEALALLVQAAEVQASDRHHSKRSASKS